jgi:GxxExxY protein
VTYKGVNLDCGYRIDVIAEDAIILELKCVEHVLPVHEAQLLSYMKMANKRVGLILNFHVATLVRGGIVRKII